MNTPVVGDRFAILVQEDEIKSMYYDIDCLKNKLKNNNLKVSEYKKISDEIDQIKKKPRKRARII